MITAIFNDQISSFSAYRIGSSADSLLLFKTSVKEDFLLELYREK